MITLGEVQDIASTIYNQVSTAKVEEEQAQALGQRVRSVIEAINDATPSNLLDTVYETLTQALLLVNKLQNKMSFVHLFKAKSFERCLEEINTRLTNDIQSLQLAETIGARRSAETAQAALAEVAEQTLAGVTTLLEQSASSQRGTVVYSNTAVATEATGDVAVHVTSDRDFSSDSTAQMIALMKATPSGGTVHHGGAVGKVAIVCPAEMSDSTRAFLLQLQGQVTKQRGGQAEAAASMLNVTGSNKESYTLPRPR